MLFFDRAPDGENLTPKSFEGKKILGLQKAIERHMHLPRDRRYQTDIPPVWKTQFDSDVLATLTELSQGCCAFCATTASLEVYRFRPPAYSQPVKPAEENESYLWLTFQWENLFPICSDCRPDNPDYFPVAGKRSGYPGTGEADNAELIYPGELNQPHRYFSIDEAGYFIGKNKRAIKTIEHFKLNTPAKAAMRMASWQEALAAVGSSNWNTQKESWLTRDGPWYLYLRRIAGNLLDQSGKRLSLSPARILQTMERLTEQPDYNVWLSTALTVVSEDSTTSRQASSSLAPSVNAPGSTRLSNITLQTYKSLESISFDIAAELSSVDTGRLAADVEKKTIAPKAPCVLILGENATGKSSILEAIALALIPATQRDALQLEASHLTLNPEYMGASSVVPVDTSQVTLTFYPNSESHPGRRVTLTISADPDTSQPFSEGGDRQSPLPPVFAYGAHRLYGKSKQRSSLRHIETLFHNDKQLPKPEVWLSRLSKSNLDQVAGALRHIIQIDGDFHTIVVDESTNSCKINIERKTPDGKTYLVPQRMDIVSSGYRAIVALVCDVLEGLAKLNNGDVFAARDMPAIVLIDEIEAHLHPRWKLHVITGLRRALPQVTFIITSHDPLCVRGMYNGEVLALNRYQNIANHGLGMPERVEPVKGFENVETLTIEQLLTSELFQLFSTDNPEMDRSIASAADELAGRPPDHDSTGVALREIENILAAALPYGQTELARLVQEAVAEFLAERRQRDQGANDAAREKAKENIKFRLRALMQ